MHSSKIKTVFCDQKKYIILSHLNKVMKIQYASDLHIEFPENEAFLKVNPIKPIGDILVLAGDIVPLTVFDKYQDFFNYLSDNFENTYWIAGNHEYYYSDLANKRGVFHEKIKENVHFLNNSIVKYENIELLFTTLWSKISPTNQWTIFNNMNDFRLIKHLDDLLSIEIYNQLHDECFQFYRILLPLTAKIGKQLLAIMYQLL